MTAEERIQLIVGALSFRSQGRDFQFIRLMRGLVEPGHTMPTTVVRAIAETLGYEGDAYCDVLFGAEWDVDWSLEAGRFWVRPRT
jgi:hypothetical protein